MNQRGRSEPGGARVEVPAAALPRLLASTSSGPGLDNHLARWGPMRCAPAALIDEVRRAGLRGRGGAGFPTAVKLAAVAAGRRAVVVANGAEGEPASRKDKTLLRLAPHLVLDGAVMAAQAVRANEAIVCVERTTGQVAETVAAAIDERRQAGVDPVALRVEAGPDRYVASQETALVHWLNGGDAKPTFTPPAAYQRGVGGRPTLVQNVETLAHLALIARFGAEWFRALGTPNDPGTALVTLRGQMERPGIYEIPLGTPTVDVLRAAGGSLTGTRAVLVGGYFGTWLSMADVAATRLSADSLAPVGASLGCGVLVALPDQVCGLVETARVSQWLAAQSAQQCGPCVNGLAAVSVAVDALVAGDRHGRAEQQLRRVLAMTDGRGACRHPDGAVRFVRSALTVFAAEISEHRQRGPCVTDSPLLPTPRPGGWR